MTELYTRQARINYIDLLFNELFMQLNNFKERYNIDGELDDLSKGVDAAQHDFHKVIEGNP